MIFLRYSDFAFRAQSFVSSRRRAATKTKWFSRFTLSCVRPYLASLQESDFLQQE
jgi:hypothetical protein